MILDGEQLKMLRTVATENRTYLGFIENFADHAKLTDALPISERADIEQSSKDWLKGYNTQILINEIWIRGNYISSSLPDAQKDYLAMLQATMVRAKEIALAYAENLAFDNLLGLRQR